MEFGTLIFTKPQRAISDTKRLEERGYQRAWFPDSQMIWGDVYACMALGAVNTKRSSWRPAFPSPATALRR